MQLRPEGFRRLCRARDLLRELHEPSPSIADLAREVQISMFRIGAIGAGVGIGIDALIRGQLSLYEVARGGTRLRAAPIVARHVAGLQVSLGF